MSILLLLPMFALGLGLLFIGTGSDEDEPDQDNEGELLIGDDGDNLLVGGPGDDTIFAGAGDDIAVGGAGDDRIFLGDGSDITVSPADLAVAELALFFPEEGSTAAIEFAGDEGDDSLYGGAQSDVLLDFEGSNTIYGHLGADFIAAIDNGTIDDADQLFGGFGNDLLIGDRGDSMTGGAGDDVFGIHVATSDATPVVIEDFQQGDFISIVSDVAGPTSVLSTEPASDATGLYVKLDDQTVAFVKGIKELEADQYGFLGLSTEPVTLNGTQNDDLLFGGAGDDLIHGGDGADYIDGAGGDDALYGDAGDDFVIDGLGSNALYGGDGNDRLDAFDTFDTASDVLDGGAGDDLLIGENGDTMTGGTGTDLFVNDVVDEAGSAPIIVTDFLPAEDTLIVNFYGGTPALGYSLALSSDGTATEVTSEGSVRAILLGLTPAQLAGADIRITTI